MYFVVEQAAASYLPDDFRMSQTVLDYLKHVRRTISPASPNGGQATPNATVQNSDHRDATSVLILLLNYSDHRKDTNCGFVYYYTRPKCICILTVSTRIHFSPYRDELSIKINTRPLIQVTAVRGAAYLAFRLRVPASNR